MVYKFRHTLYIIMYNITIPPVLGEYKYEPKVHTCYERI